MTQAILVAGATGMLGSRIAHHLLLEEPATDVRLLVRPQTATGPQRSVRLSPLVRRGARVVEGDLTDDASLDRATAGVDVIVSAVQGGPEVVVDGQLALVDAGKKNGVRRILPSDFGLDFFDAPDGQNTMFDIRRVADETIQTSGLEHVHVLNGAFMDEFFASSCPLIDVKNKVARFWGEGDERFDVTSVEDTARYAAKAAIDRSLPSGKFAVAGQHISFQEIVDTVERVTSRTFKRERLGSLSDLRAWIADKRRADADPSAVVAGSYQLLMLTARRLEQLQNHRYLDIVAENFTEYLQRTPLNLTFDNCA